MEQVLGFVGTVFNQGVNLTGDGHLDLTDQKTWARSKDVHVAPGETATVKYGATHNGHACVAFYYPADVLFAEWSACIN